MLYVYLVVLWMNGAVNTYTPPVTFSTYELCEEFKKINMQKLEETKPSTGNPKAVGMCISVPREI